MNLWVVTGDACLVVQEDVVVLVRMDVQVVVLGHVQEHVREVVADLAHTDVLEVVICNVNM